MPPTSVATLSRALRRHLRSLTPPRRRGAARGAAAVVAVLAGVLLLAAASRVGLLFAGGGRGGAERGGWLRRLSPPPPLAVPSLTINGESAPVVGRPGMLSTGGGDDGGGGREGEAAAAAEAGAREEAAGERGGGGDGPVAAEAPASVVAQVLLVVNPRRWAASPPTVLAALLASLHTATYPAPVRLDVVLIADDGGGSGGLPPPDGEAAKRALLRDLTWTSSATGEPLGPLTTRTVRGRAYGGYLAAWAAAAAAVAGGGGVDGDASAPPRPPPPPLVVLEETSPPLHPGWFVALAAARAAYGADVRVAGYALHPLTSVRVRSAGTAAAAAAAWAAAPVDAGVAAAGVALSSGLSPAGATAYAPARRADWAAFAAWLTARRREWYLWPVIPPGLKYPPRGVGPGGAGDPKKSPAWTAFTGRTVAHWGGWHARYLAEMEGSGGVVAHLDVATLAAAGAATVAVPPLAALPRYTLNGTLLRPAGSVAAGSHPPLLPPDVRSQLLALAAAHGNTLSLTVVTRDFLPFARSWVCNVDAAGVRPPGVVWVATDADAAAALAAIPATATVRLDALAAAPRGRRDGYGSRAYWGLMLARTRLIGELLGAGVDVFAFETDAVWLGDPLTHIRSVLAADGDGGDGGGSGGGVDLVGTFDSRHEVAGNLLYLRPTPATRRLWAAVTARFAASVAGRYARGRRSPKGDYAYIENDQSLLTKELLYGADRDAVPVVFRALDTDRFVDGRWYPAVAGTPGDAGGAYRSAAAAAPVLVNLNFIIGVGEKVARAVAAGHWFWVDAPAGGGGDGRCDTAAVAAAVAANEARRVAAAGRGEGGGGGGGGAAAVGGLDVASVGDDVEADPDMVADAVLGLRG
ncbi:hypothetical protein I4F81_005129 [Pyropia yezoensis]|uniref:Uncharacterized protein n=1 Tax=Pyropia yezoensis TaxID=2788 RepID=A0ACC3BWY1_PYRYE|nr:hypothetical protein I4F81_005129 [Neopyropia yezoensis]